MNFIEELQWRGMIHDMMPGIQEQLEKERELLLNLVKERDRMNEIVASVPLPDEIIIDKEIEDGAFLNHVGIKIQIRDKP